MRHCLCFTLFISTAALVMGAIAIGIPYWMYTDNPVEQYQGLWERCRMRNEHMECSLLKMQPELLDATRVMLLFGMIMYLFATICLFMYMFVKQEKSSLGTAATFLNLFGAIFCMIAVIVYGTLHNRLLYADTMNLHAGFALAVVSTVAGFLSTITICMSKARGEID